MIGNVGARLEGRFLWLLIATGSMAGAVAFGVLREWLPFGLFGASGLIATAQLIRIQLRPRAGGGGKRRW
jgi:uncharacterized protein (DUF2062 family)